jgi:hypothetical protein
LSAEILAAEYGIGEKTIRRDGDVAHYRRKARPTRRVKGKETDVAAVVLVYNRNQSP